MEPWSDDLGAGDGCAALRAVAAAQGHDAGKSSGVGLCVVSLNEYVRLRVITGPMGLGNVEPNPIACCGYCLFFFILAVTRIATFLDHPPPFHTHPFVTALNQPSAQVLNNEPATVTQQEVFRSERTGLAQRKWSKSFKKVRSLSVPLLFCLLGRGNERGCVGSSTRRVGLALVAPQRFCRVGVVCRHENGPPNRTCCAVQFSSGLNLPPPPPPFPRFR